MSDETPATWAASEYDLKKSRALAAVYQALTDSEDSSILRAAFSMYPSLNGALVTDVLDYLENRDAYLWWTEPLYEDNRKKIEQLNISPHIWNYAVIAVILKGPLFREVKRVALRAQHILEGYPNA